VVIAPWTTVKFRLTGLRQTTGSAVASTTVATVVNTLAQLYPTQGVQLYPVPSAVQVADRPQMTRFADVNDIFVSATSPQQVELAIRQITELLRERHRLQDGQPDDFRIRNLTEISERIAATGKLMTNLLLWVATISLVVGGVGIMNIMLASVKERTREIGLRMAVGARSRDILSQFLTEAVMLCLFGGAVGILLGRGASMAATTFLNWPTVPSLEAIVGAVAVSASVGILFGFYPAWKASRLDPIEALRYE
jgi:ABC-type antimicrobial peptide transport system permease subunit